jgi:hypothetical protein
MRPSDIAKVADVALARGHGRRIYTVHAHPTKPGEVRPCDHCGVGGRLASWDWPGRTEPVWLHEKCEAQFAAANPSPTAPDDGLDIPDWLRRSPADAIRMPGGGLDFNRAPHQPPDRRPALGPEGDDLADIGDFG